MAERFTQLFDDQWFRPNRKDMKLACCDCGLVHTYEFKIVKRTLYMRVRRDRRATANARRRPHKCRPLST